MHDASNRQVYALCGVDPSKGNHLPLRGRCVCEVWDPDPAGDGGFRGLLWGRGEPTAAFLDARHWAVVRIEDPGGPVVLAGAVKFRIGHVVYSGERRGALETLILEGADPAAMAARRVAPGLAGIADTGAYGIAVAGEYGLARAGPQGAAIAGTCGLALAGDAGTATVGDVEGLAVSGGDAWAGEESVAVACGPSGSAVAGALGIAVALGRARTIEAGLKGWAVAFGPVRSLCIGAEGIAVQLHAMDGRDVVRAGRDALLVTRSSLEPRRFTVAVAGEDGFAVDQPLIRWAGRWYDRTTVPPEARAEPERAAWPPPSMARVEPAKDDKVVAGEAAPRPDPLLGNDIVVLCGVHAAQGDELGRERILATNWDSAPGSETGFFGLPWGIGDTRAGGLAGCEQWMLVRVAEALPALHPGIVRFAAGDVLFRGARRLALKMLLNLGTDPEALSTLYVQAKADGIARAGDDAVAVAEAGGWALAGSDGEAVAGSGGVAIGLYQSYAEAGQDGVAVTDEMGVSSAGTQGVAINRGKRFGEARVGDGGVAVGMGRSKVVSSGANGAALLMGYGTVVAGDGGVAIGRGDRVRAGRNGVAVALDGWVSGDLGCLLVRRWHDGERFRFATGIVGEAGVEPFVAYGVSGGRLCSEASLPDASDVLLGASGLKH